MTTGPRRGDDRGSMPLTMLLAIVAVGLSLVVATVVNGQQRETRFALQRVNAVNAAQTGLDVALDNLRMATRADGSGDPAALPCSTMAGPVSVAGGASYRVRVLYTRTAPPSGDTAWAALAANRWACGSTATSVPAYALIVSTGSAGVTRTLTATYAFSTVTRVDRVGIGQVRAYSDDDGSYCLSSGHGAPVIGNTLWLKKCDDGDPKQRFVYQPGLSIAMAELTAPGGERLCIDGGLPMEAGNQVKLQACRAEAVPQQVWGLDDSSAFYIKPDAATELCLTANHGDMNGDRVSLSEMAQPNMCVNEFVSTATFIPEAQFGSGKAGPDTHQLVNGEQFSRCVDVAANPATDNAVIVFPCKQPLTGAVRWDQHWTTPVLAAGASRAEGRIYTQTGGTAYCLRSPDGAAPGANRITVEACDINAAVPSRHRWVVNGETGQAATSHRIESAHLADAANPTLCMAATVADADPDAWKQGNIVLSRLRLVGCNGSDLQKWRTSATANRAGLSDITEQ